MGLHSQGYYPTGSLEVISGPMFSGKTEELIRRVRRAQIARQKVQIFKPKIDTRYDKNKVVSHSHISVQAEIIDRSVEILHKLLDTTRIIAIDEVQFFDDDIVMVVKKLAMRGHRVVCAGLDLDFRGNPFGPMPTLLALADEVTKIQAICTVCGAMATRTQRIVHVEELVVVGETEAYEARCRSHYDDMGPEEQFLPLQTEIQFGTTLDQ